MNNAATEWITKGEAVKRAKAIATVIPRARFENFAMDKQVRLANGSIAVCYSAGRAKDYKMNPEIKGMYRRITVCV